MTLTEAQAMTPEEKNAKLAELHNTDAWVIVKRGAYYLPGGNGYTYEIERAWILPHAEAKKHEMYADRDEVPHCEKVLIKPAPIPDYCNDLNAVAEAERSAFKARPGFYERAWFYTLHAIVTGVDPSTEGWCDVDARTCAEAAMATADQRTTALILTLSQA